MIRLISINETEVLKDDPVRPHIDKLDKAGKQVYVLDDLSAVICTCLCNDVPTTEKQLEDLRNDLGDILVAYTVWSNKKGAGRDIVNQLLDVAKEKNIKRLVTLSPLTEMAERFHVRNGATLVSKSDTCQNFEYELS